MPARSPGTLRLLLRPSMFLLHVPAVAAVVTAVLLGNWQLDAWQMHREDRAAELADADPEPLQQVLGPDDPFPAAGVGQPVEAVGRWVPDGTVFVSGRERGGSDGFWMVTPLSTCGTEQCADPSAIPVVLGWVAAVGDAPEPPTGATGPGGLTGWLQPGEGTSEADTDPTDEVLPALRVADLLQRVDQDLYGGFVILDEPAAPRAGLEAVTPDSLPEAPTFTALRNLLYGVEWWLFAGFAVFLWWRWTRDELESARARARAEAGDVTPVSPAVEPGPEAREARIPSEP